MVEPAEHRYLPRHEPHALRLHRVEPHLLQRHHPAGLHVPRLVHVAIRPRPDLKPRANTEVEAFLNTTRQRFDLYNGEGRRNRTLASFWKQSARRGVHPRMASPATATSQAGQPEASERGAEGMRGLSWGGGGRSFSAATAGAWRLLTTQPMGDHLHGG